ncbi:MAG: hypothetical protein K8S13_23130 [Desulfobacula sp.]|uniref:hypothetical protein n=1 Tax=Desulfobacula sp. TaxID=2593537 RepID=UPI0025C06F7B|nr:hypothetical protein [Desulfobacula sp.]MCD4722723.1 hypothetical protein [Desulfobacula sp.]
MIKRIILLGFFWVLFFMPSSLVFGSEYQVTTELSIMAVINTVEKGAIDAVWKKGGEETTSSGDQVIWGFFYASSSDVTWGSENNPDLYVKIWFDHGGRIDVNFFHVSVPDIDVYSVYSGSSTSNQYSKTTMENRYYRHEYGTGSENNTQYSASYFPITAEDSCGKVIAPYWIYKINGGNPLSVSMNNINLGMQFSDLRVDINASGTKRSVKFNASVSGDATGTIDVNVDSDLTASVSTTLIQNEALTMDMSLSVPGESVTVKFYMNIIFSPEAEWFLDREDLDTFSVGYIFNEQNMVTATMDGYIDISGYGIEYFDSSGTSAEIWEILAKDEIVTVNGITYQNVIKVERNTIIPDMNSTNGTQDMTIIYWVAKGIGMVKGMGQYSILGEQLSIELTGTNLISNN